MRFAGLVFLLLLTGCASMHLAMIPDSPRITTGNDERPSLAVIQATPKPVPMSVGISVSKDASQSLAVEYQRTDQKVVFDYGSLEPHLLKAIQAQAPKTFERVFYTAEHPNVALWREGIDAVLVIESAHANKFTVKDSSKNDSSRPYGLFGGWEVVIVAGIYTIDGRPLGYYDEPRSVTRAVYRIEVVAPPPANRAEREAEGKKASANCASSFAQCMADLQPLEIKMLAEAVEVAVGQALRGFRADEVEMYIARRQSDIDAGYAAFLAGRENVAFVRGLSDDVRPKIEELTPRLDKPNTDKVTWAAALEKRTVELQRTSAQLNAVGGALGTLQAQNLARMGHQNAARLTALNAQTQTQAAQRTFAELERRGLGGMDSTTQGLLTLLGGVASYSQYREQKQQLANASKADPRSCPELLRMRDQAIANRNNMRSVSRQAGTSTSSLGGQAGSQQDAANAYTTIYNTYCR